MVKLKDKYATKDDVSKKDKSVVSKLTLEQMATNASAREWQSHKPSTRQNNRAVEKQTDKSLYKKGIKSPFPERIWPMLCTKDEKPFDNEDWIFELKLDGMDNIFHALSSPHQ